MLNGIKNMINSKKEFTEAADLLLEGTQLVDKLEESIILGEATDDDAPVEDGNDATASTDNPDTGDNDDENNDGKLPLETPENGGDLENEPIEDPKTDDTGSDDIMDAPIDGSDDEPMNLPGDNSLPTPVGKQTGEEIGDADILTAEIDLGSNTVKDVLPVPPNNAPEAVNDDIMNQRIDDGFGDEGPSTEPSPENPMGAPTEPIQEPSNTEDPSATPGEESTDESDLESPPIDETDFESTIFAGFDNIDESTKKEIIKRFRESKECKDDKDCKDKKECEKDKECNHKKCDDGKCEHDDDDDEYDESHLEMYPDEDEPYTEEIVMSGDDGTAPASDDNKAEDAPAEEPADDTASEGEEESPVTAAVKDKVSEMDTPIEPETAEDAGASKDALMKKLASLSKNMEDVKLMASKLQQ